MKVKHEESRKKEQEKKIMWKKIKKHISFYVKESEIKNVFYFYFNKLMIELLYKKTYFNTKKLNPCLFSMIVSSLQEFKDVFPKRILSVLQPIREIEYQT